MAGHQVRLDVAQFLAGEVPPVGQQDLNLVALHQTFSFS